MITALDQRAMRFEGLSQSAGLAFSRAHHDGFGIPAGR